MLISIFIVRCHDDPAVESKMRRNYAIVFVSDTDTSVAFYRDVFGLPLKFETPEWTEFSTAGATLALHKAKGALQIEAGQESSAPGQCRPGIIVEDLDAFHSQMVERGATCVQAPKDVFGARIAQYLDPDGLAVSVSESKGGTNKSLNLPPGSICHGCCSMSDIFSRNNRARYLAQIS